LQVKSEIPRLILAKNPRGSQNSSRQVCSLFSTHRALHRFPIHTTPEDKFTAANCGSETAGKPDGGRNWFGRAFLPEIGRPTNLMTVVLTNT